MYAGTLLAHDDRPDINGRTCVDNWIHGVGEQVLRPFALQSLSDCLSYRTTFSFCLGGCSAESAQGLEARAERLPSLSQAAMLFRLTKTRGLTTRRLVMALWRSRSRLRPSSWA